MIFLIISYVVGAILLVWDCIIYVVDAEDVEDDKDVRNVILLAVIFMLIIFALYMLADNVQPLDCAFGCNTFASNQTIIDIGCDKMGSSTLRFFSTLIAFLFVLFFSLGLFFYSDNKEAQHAIKDAENFRTISLKMFHYLICL